MIRYLQNFLQQEFFDNCDDFSINDFVCKNNLQNKVDVIKCEETVNCKYVILKYSQFSYHIVKPNQTLEDIAKMYNITVQELKNKNSISNVFIGQQLII